MTLKEFYDWIGEKLPENGNKDVYYVDTLIYPELKNIYMCTADEDRSVVIGGG